jgi:hypothetical protein
MFEVFPPVHRTSVGDTISDFTFDSTDIYLPSKSTSSNLVPHDVVRKLVKRGHRHTSRAIHNCSLYHSRSTLAYYKKKNEC